MKVLVTAPYMLPVIDRFRYIFDERGIELVVPHVEERLEEAELLPLVSDIDGVICGDDRFTENVLQAAPKLKVLSKWGTGIDSIDQEACKRHNVAVCNTVNAFTEPVSDSILGYMLSFARNVLPMNSAMHNGIWKKLPGRALRECTLGVIGVGNIGRAVIRRASAFGMNALGNDPVLPPDDFLQAYSVQMVSKDELLRNVDFVIIGCTLNPTSYHLMDDAAFVLMKPGAVIINTARGPIIDEQALIRALQGGKIAGAALDVFEEEPLPVDSPLREMSNVLMAPHNSNSSAEAWERVHHNTIRNLLGILEGGNG